ncbi:hypothetical protein GCM10028833_38330 [Glycomyces tarimensis]
MYELLAGVTDGALETDPQRHRQRDRDGGQRGLPHASAFEPEPVQPYGGLAHVPSPSLDAREAATECLPRVQFKGTGREQGAARRLGDAVP